MKVPTFPKSKEEWVHAITTDTPSGKSSQWVNTDLAPTPKDARTWTWYAFDYDILERLVAEVQLL